MWVNIVMCYVAKSIYELKMYPYVKIGVLISQCG